MIVDLFAGPGGWDLGARWAGLPDPVGLEWDATACATRALHAMPTIRADLADYPIPAHLAGQLDGLIASPPCTTFSTAGKGEGRDALPALVDAIHAELDHATGCATTDLVTVPLRWATALRPRWCAWEQVPPVLAVWEACAAVLEAHGYRCWTGVLCAADVGVPQTRRRAFLLAHRDRQPSPPDPTHACEPDDTLFGTLAPWVSMADALGWAFPPEVERPRVSTSGGNRFDAADPSWALTEKARSWTMRGNNTVAGGPLAERGSDEPAMTVGSRADLWVLDRRGWAANPAGDDDIMDPITVERPAPTLSSTAGEKGVWQWRRPATTVNGDPRLGSPGRHDPNVSGSQYGPDSVRLSVEDALVLQSFPPDYALAGTRTARFRQVGNAIPVRWGAYILHKIATGREWDGQISNQEDRWASGE